MPLVQWEASYSVKVKRCDDDHKKLFAMINTLHDAMTTGRGSQKIAEIVNGLRDYAKYHFSAEEQYLEKTNYPALSSHRAEHQAFVKRVEEFQKDVDAGKAAQSFAVVQFFNDWLVHHIKQIDQKYSPHLNANGIS